MSWQHQYAEDLVGKVATNRNGAHHILNRELDGMTWLLVLTFSMKKIMARHGTASASGQ